MNYLTSALILVRVAALTMRSSPLLCHIQPMSLLSLGHVWRGPNGGNSSYQPNEAKVPSVFVHFSQLGRIQAGHKDLKILIPPLQNLGVLLFIML
jgi:hypothetical protein